MPEFRDYPRATSTQPTDAFLIERLGVGTMYIEASDFLPSLIYDVAMYYPGEPPPSSTIFVFTAVRPVSLPVALEGSEFNVQTAPSGALAIGLQKNGNAIGTVSFSNGSMIGTPSFGAEVAFAPGDELRVTTPSDIVGADGLSMTFVFERDN